MRRSSLSPRTNPCRPQLVEILIGILVVGVLASLLPSVLRSLRADANRAMCGNNLRTISLAILAYEGENGVLPGPTERAIRSPLDGNRPGATIPREDWPNFNVDMSLLLEDYLGAFDSEDPGPFFCHSNLESSGGDVLVPVYILMRNIKTNPPSFFGDMDFADARRFPKSVAEIVAAGTGLRSREATELSQIWMIGDIDAGNYSAYGSGGGAEFSTEPVHDGGRNYVFFDGHLEYLKPDSDGMWRYPASTGDTGNHGD